MTKLKRPIFWNETSRLRYWRPNNLTIYAYIIWFDDKPNESWCHAKHKLHEPAAVHSRSTPDEIQARMTPRDLLEAKSVAVGVDGTLVPKERASRGMVCGAAS